MLNAALRKEIEKIARANSIPPENLMAVTHVESAGVTYWNVNGKMVPAMRPERHYFHRLLKGAERAEAVRQGLASPAMGGVPSNRAAVYAIFDRMCKINKPIAIESCSWGLGQVMGENWRRLGYASAQALYDENQSGTAGQIACMVKFITADKRCLTAIRNGDFTTFARIYNGPAYKQNNYDNQMRNWAARYRPMVGQNDNAPEVQQVVAQVETEQTKKVKQLGFKTIAEFQAANGLVPDGLWGPMTEREVNRQLAVKNKTAGEVKAATGGASGILFSNFGGEILSSVSQLSGIPLAGVQAVTNILIVAAVGLMLWGVWQRMRAGNTEAQ